jgi:hypothetical protein
MTDTSRYPAYSFWSVEDERFIALALDLPGCSASAPLKPRHSANCNLLLGLVA